KKFAARECRGVKIPPAEAPAFPAPAPPGEDAMSTLIAVRPSRFLAALLAALAATCAAARPAAAVAYKLDAGSRFETGCFNGPCDCGIRTLPMAGNFRLTETAPDPLYRYFDVSDVQWKFEDGSGVVQVTGSGHYQVGGEFVAMQRMELDLSVGGR